jgi:excisionase family DNA binding protein
MPTLKDLAEVMRVHPTTLQRAVKRGEIRVTRFGDVIRIPWSEYYRLTGETHDAPAG